VDAREVTTGKLFFPVNPDLSDSNFFRGGPCNPGLPRQGPAAVKRLLRVPATTCPGPSLTRIIGAMGAPHTWTFSAGTGRPSHREKRRGCRTASRSLASRPHLKPPSDEDPLRSETSFRIATRRS